MAKIPLGNFGNVIAQPPQTRARALSKESASPVGTVLRDMGNWFVSSAAESMDKERKEDAEVRRSQAALTVVSHESEIQDTLSDVEEQLASGAITREKAPEAFENAVKKARSRSMNEFPAEFREGLGLRLQNAEVRASMKLNRSLGKHRQQELAGNLGYIRDTLATDAGRPGADIERINADFADVAMLLGPQAGIDEAKIGEQVRQFQAGNWFNQAQARANAAREDLGALQQIEKDLADEDGFYVSRLPPNKRNALLSSVMSNRMRMESKAQLSLDRREAAAERTLGRIDQQIASGVPASPAMWAEWEGAVQGTTHAGAFAERIAAEEEVQRLLREPPEKQEAFIREREAHLLQGGGSLRDKANVDRLRKVIDVSRKQLQESPLLFAQNRTGDAIKPLDMGMLGDPGRLPEMVGVMNERVATVSALRRQYGDSVKARVLLPNEAEAMGKMLDRMAPDQQVEIFRGLRNVIGDDDAYHGALFQIAADSPVKALAGTLAARGMDYMQSHLFRPDESVSATQTARLALLGESLLNPTKAQKAQDGRTNSFIMPKKADMLRRFSDKVGDTFAGTPQALDAQFELVQATYAGMLASRGGTRSPEVVDSSLFDQAIERTTPVMKQGGVSFLKPVVGMSDERFREKLYAALPDELKGQADRLPLRNVRSNQYMIMKGARPLTGPDGRPLIVTVQP